MPEVHFNTTHGKSDTPTYRAWRAMLTRCYNQRCASYVRYGGRGILVCRRWRSSFENFLKDMGERPQPGMSIHRRHNDRSYCKQNCVWATAKIQANARRNNRLLTVNGITRTLQAWSTLTGLSHQVIVDRLERKKMKLDEALSTPTRKTVHFYPGSPLFEHKGEMLPLAEWAKREGVNYWTLRYRVLKKHMSLPEALCQKLHQR